MTAKQSFKALLLGMAAAPASGFALTLGESVHGRETLLFTGGLTAFTLALFVAFFVLALRQKRS